MKSKVKCKVKDVVKGKMSNKVEVSDPARPVFTGIKWNGWFIFI